MPDIDLQKTGKTGGRDKHGRFEKGCSGNPAGRPPGIPNPTIRAGMLLDAEAEALIARAIELAIGGDTVAMRLCLDRIIGPRRGRPVELALPPIGRTTDLAAAMTAVVAAVAEGTITPDEAVALSQTMESFTRTLEAAHVERRRFWRGQLMIGKLKIWRRHSPSGHAVTAASSRRA